MLSFPDVHPLGAVLSALIVACSVAALTMHRDFYTHRPRRDFFCFYTNISVLVVLIYFAVVAPRLYAHSALLPLIVHAEFAVTMIILLTFSVFHLILLPGIVRQLCRMPRDGRLFLLLWDNVFLHELVPLLVLSYFIFCTPNKTQLRAADAFLWTIVPISFAIRILLRARVLGKKAVIEETGSRYPYPFLDVGLWGGKRVFAACACLYAVCTSASLAIIAFFRT